MGVYTSTHVLNKNLVNPNTVVYNLEYQVYPEKLRDGWMIGLTDIYI